MDGKSLDHLKQVVSVSRFAEKASEIQASMFEEVFSQPIQTQHTNKNPDVVLNIWDCGGQPVATSATKASVRVLLVLWCF